MGFFDGLGGRKRRRGLGFGDEDSPDLQTLQAQADATRIRLSDHLYEGVSRVPPSEGDDGDGDSDAAVEGIEQGPAGHAMPDEKPDPAAQWDDVRGCWIKWDPDANRWVDLPEAGRAGS